MCGILGQISINQIKPDDFTSDLLKLHHRGPDDHGTYFETNVALGQTRLSIIDLSHEGHQPMISQCANYVMIYNGEVYNFEEIKKDLVAKSYKFHSHTDTEVILNGFIEYKEQIVDKLNGMFAFAIYNKSTRELFLARDRSGIKPLYYFHDDKNFVFSSELKSLKSHSKAINFDAKILFLLLGYVPEPMTIYSGLSSFPAGHFGVLSNHELKLQQFDEYKYEPKIQKSYKEIIADVSELFDNAVKRHLISDAPIGTFLSGGLDSSIITAVAAKYKTNLQTLSLVFNEKELSEEYYQDLIVKKYNTKHTKYLIDETLFLESIEDFFEAMEQPTIDGLNTFFVSKAAKEAGLTTVLSGVGGDEIFYGYPSFKNGKTLKFLSNIPYFLIKILQNQHKYKKLELLQAEKDLAYYLPKRGLFSPTEIAKLLNIDIAKIYHLISELWHTYNSSHITHIHDKISFFELNMYMKNQLLRDTDVFGMVHSLEIRVPFLDKELVDYVLRVEPKEKFGIYNKQILADIAKGIVPHEVIDRPKMGFTLPFEKWMRNNIDRFEAEADISERFRNKKLHWSRFLALHILKKIEEKASL
jgi:asparagine synthase (glutamine-hydrolysing)